MAQVAEGSMDDLAERLAEREEQSIRRRSLSSDGSRIKEKRAARTDVGRMLGKGRAWGRRARTPHVALRHCLGGVPEEPLPTGAEAHELTQERA